MDELAAAQYCRDMARQNLQTGYANNYWRAVINSCEQRIAAINSGSLADPVAVPYSALGSTGGVELLSQIRSCASQR